MIEEINVSFVFPHFDIFYLGFDKKQEKKKKLILNKTSKEKKG